MTPPPPLNHAKVHSRLRLAGLLALLVFHSCDNSTRPVGPALVVAQAHHDFGDVYLDEEVAHTFTLENGGSQVLELGRIRTPCGCAVLSLSRERLAPGETAELSLRLQARKILGLLEKSIRVPSNDPVRPITHLEFRAHVTPLYVFEPPCVELGRLRVGEVREIDVEVQVSEGGPVRILDIEPPDDRVEAVLTGAAEGRRFPLTVRVRGGPAGPYLAHLRMHTDHPRQPLISIPIRGKVISNVVVEPSPSLDFGSIARDEGARLVVSIRHVDAAGGLPRPDFELHTNLREAAESLEGEAAEIQGHWKTLEEGLAYELVLEIAPGASQTVLFGRLEIQTGLPGEQVQTLTLHGVFKP